MAERVLGERYRVERHLARGGMADVYLAQDLLLERPVALKVPFSQFASDPAFVERFRREARAAAKLNHPNIVSVYDWGEDEGTNFIVMEYVEGPTLAEVARAGPLAPERAAEIGAEIALALAFAHRQGVVHRDVKPGNVIISPTGQVKVTDFGIARAGDPSDSLTQTGAVMGTATYFSPEQAQGLPVDPRSDVYSLGVVLYEVVAGRPPFVGESPVTVAYQHVREDPDPPSAHNPHVPPELDAIVAKAMAKDVAHRYASADDLRADLVRFYGGKPVEAEAEAMRAGASGQMAATVADAPPVDGTEVLSRTAVATAAPPPVADRRRRRLPPWLLALILLAGVGVLVALALLASRRGAATVAVPDVRRLDVAEARARLERADLRPTEVRQPSDQPANQVIDQSPPPGREVASGSEVSLTVAAPPPPPPPRTPTTRRPRPTVATTAAPPATEPPVTEPPVTEAPATTSPRLTFPARPTVTRPSGPSST